MLSRGSARRLSCAPFSVFSARNGHPGYPLNNLIVLKIGRPLTPGPCHLSQAPSPLAIACEARLRAPMLLPALANTGVARGGHCPSRINHSLFPQHLRQDTPRTCLAVKLATAPSACASVHGGVVAVYQYRCSVSLLNESLSLALCQLFSVWAVCCH